VSSFPISEFTLVTIKTLPIRLTGAKSASVKLHDLDGKNCCQNGLSDIDAERTKEVKGECIVRRRFCCKMAALRLTMMYCLFDAPIL
jgi:hypothetical protein